MRREHRLTSSVGVAIVLGALCTAGLPNSWQVVAPFGVRAAHAGTLDDQLAGGSTGTSVSAHASASSSASSSGSGAGCTAEASSEALAQSGNQVRKQSAHKRADNANGPCEATSGARATAGPGSSQN